MAAFATSYIKTVASQVTRAADSASMTGTNFSSWYTQSGGTVYAEAIKTATSGFGRLFAISDNTNNNRIDYTTSTSTTGQPTIVAAGVTSCDLSPGGWVPNVSSKIATSFELNNFKTSKDSGNVVLDTLGNLPVVDRLYIGAGALGNSAFLNGTIKKISYYPIAATSAQLQALTS